MIDTPALDGFAGRTRRDQVLTASGGAIACLAGYLGAVVLVSGDLSVLPGDGRTPRRLAIAGAGVACWGYYGLAFVRARGGPVLDALVYPLLTVGIVPTLSRWLAFGVDAGDLFPGLSLEPLVLVALAVGPGVVSFGVVLAVWAARLDEGARREWERRHLTPAFREEFLE